MPMVDLHCVLGITLPPSDANPSFSLLSQACLGREEEVFFFFFFCHARADMLPRVAAWLVPALQMTSCPASTARPDSTRLSTGSLPVAVAHSNDDYKQRRLCPILTCPTTEISQANTDPLSLLSATRNLRRNDPATLKRFRAQSDRGEMHQVLVRPSSRPDLESHTSPVPYLSP